MNVLMTIFYGYSVRKADIQNCLVDYFFFFLNRVVRKPLKSV
jgi:hypothetical protein